MEIKTLYNIWQSLFHENYILKINQSFETIIKNYNKSNRKYHNLKHISDLIQQINQLNCSAKERTTLLLAAFLHDLIYVPGHTNNEEKSALLAIQLLSKLGVTKFTIDKVTLIIRATKNHQSEDYLAKLFLDIDLSILGSSEKEYTSYYHAIRAEHKIVPRVIYNYKRKKFLQTLIQNDFIFLTDKFRKELEMAARTNIKNEIELLS